MSSCAMDFQTFRDINEIFEQLAVRDVLDVQGQEDLFNGLNDLDRAALSALLQAVRASTYDLDPSHGLHAVDPDDRLPEAAPFE